VPALRALLVAAYWLSAVGRLNAETASNQQPVTNNALRFAQRSETRTLPS
jgi:hypothetical protein